jgi:hypothetical protein
VSVVLRLVLAVAGFVLMLSLLFAGLVAAVLFVLWNLLRGRKPVMAMPRFSMPPGRQWGFPNNARGPAQAPGDVVDVQARVVPEAPPQIERRD